MATKLENLNDMIARSKKLARYMEKEKLYDCDLIEYARLKRRIIKARLD